MLALVIITFPHQSPSVVSQESPAVADKHARVATRKHAKNCSTSTCLQRCRWQDWPILQARWSGTHCRLSFAICDLSVGFDVFGALLRRYYSRDISASSAIEMYQWYCAIKIPISIYLSIYHCIIGLYFFIVFIRYSTTVLYLPNRVDCY